MADDALDVGLLADDVVHHGVGDAERVEELSGVGADRDAAVADHDLDAGAPQVVDVCSCAGFDFGTITISLFVANVIGFVTSPSW